MKYAKPLSKHDKGYKDLLIIFFSFSVAALSELNEKIEYNRENLMTFSNYVALSPHLFRFLNIELTNLKELF